jgi:putative CocE/NonD family hydrolase
MAWETFFPGAPAKRYHGVRTESRYLTMRDGVQIAVDVLLPWDLEPHERLPAVLTMTRYWRSFELRIPEPRRRAPIAPREPLADDLVARGFAMVVVDARGSGASRGVSRHPWTPDEIADYGEVAAWAASQSWCNGSVGATGISYEGSTALLVTTAGVDAVKAAVPQQIEWDVYTDIAFPGGVPNRAFIKAWSSGNERLDRNELPAWLPIPWFVRWMLKGVRPVDCDRDSRAALAAALADHRSNVDVERAMSTVTCRDDMFGDTGATLDGFSPFAHTRAIEASGTALFSWGSWLDSATADAVLRMYETLGNPQVAVIGAWSHEKNKHGSPYVRRRSKSDPDQATQWEAIARFLSETL